MGNRWRGTSWYSQIFMDTGMVDHLITTCRYAVHRIVALDQLTIEGLFWLQVRYV
jgi:hypothetical protein